MIRSSFKKKKKEIAPWRQGILSHHQDRPSSADRNEFPPKVIKELIAEAGSLCQSCKSAQDTTTHHVWPRGRHGRGVKTNGLRLCWPCHDRIQTNEDELQHWIEVYRQRYGDHFWFDELDWQEYERRQAAERSAEAEQQQRSERLEPIVNLITAAAGRAPKAKEKRLLDGMDDKQLAVLAGMIADMTKGLTPTETEFGYGRFND